MLLFVLFRNLQSKPTAQSQVISRIVVQRIGNQEHPRRPVLLRQAPFRREQRVPGAGLSVEGTLGVLLAGLVAQHQNELPRDMEAVVVVPAVLGRGDAVAGEDQRSLDGSGVREAERTNVDPRVAAELLTTYGRCNEVLLRVVALAVDFEVDEVVRLAGQGLESVARELGRDVLLGPVDLGPAGLPSEHLVGSKEQDVLSKLPLRDAVRPAGTGRGRGCAARSEQGSQQHSATAHSDQRRHCPLPPSRTCEWPDMVPEPRILWF